MMKRRHVMSALALAPLFVGLPRMAMARIPEINAPGGLAMAGADAVAYFREGRHVQGQAGHALMWRGATWLFASSATMEAFEMSPEAFVPKFGGYCAFAMSEGEIAPGDPSAFTLHDGALYLSFSPAIRTRLEADLSRRIVSAQANWPAILGE